MLTNNILVLNNWAQDYKGLPSKTNTNKQIPWGIYVPHLIFIWGVKNGKVNQRTTGPVSNT